jgi:hypothetical protein
MHLTNEMKELLRERRIQLLSAATVEARVAAMENGEPDLSWDEIDKLEQLELFEAHRATSA